MEDVPLKLVGWHFILIFEAVAIYYMKVAWFLLSQTWMEDDNDGANNESFFVQVDSKIPFRQNIFLQMTVEIVSKYGLLNILFWKLKSNFLSFFKEYLVWLNSYKWNASHKKGISKSQSRYNKNWINPW